MLWNELSYEMQMRVLDRISDLISGEKDEELQFAIAAAVVELEVWSNTPCTIVEEESYVAQAQDAYEEQ